VELSKDDLISRAAACNAISKMIHEYRENGEDATADGMILAMRYGIKRLPTVDAVPVVHGRWVIIPGSIWPIGDCSVCGEQHIGTNSAKYCPNCGARMDGEADA